MGGTAAHSRAANRVLALPATAGGSGLTPLFFVNNLRSIADIDVKLCIALRTSLLRPYTKIWTISSKTS